MITSAPGPMSSARKRDGERIGSRADTDGVSAIAGGATEFLLERFELRSEDEPAARHHPPDRRLDRGGILPGVSLEKRNHPKTSSGAGSSR